MAIVALKDDFTTLFNLDKELTDKPKSGIYLNSGVHPSITTENLLAFLPYPDFNFDNYNQNTTYQKYSETLKRSDVVRHDGQLYQSLTNDNAGNQLTNQTHWMLTNLDSLKLKMFINKVIDRVKSDLHLEKRLVNNQFIYETNFLRDQQFTTSYGFAGWVFEPKGSDYLTITINQMSLKSLVPGDATIYVLNQGQLVDTIELEKSSKLDFKDVDYSFSGFGRWQFVYEQTEVLTNRSIVEPLQFDGFVCYTCVTQSTELEGAQWSWSTIGNGLVFNVSCSLNSDLYIKNNFTNLGGLIKATFELMTLEMFLANAHNRSNRQQDIQLDKDALIAETKSLEMNTAAKRFTTELRKAKNAMQKTFDTHLFLDADDCLEIEIGSV
jgi:hypothetical protein